MLHVRRLEPDLFGQISEGGSPFGGRLWEVPPRLVGRVQVVDSINFSADLVRHLGVFCQFEGQKREVHEVFDAAPMCPRTSVSVQLVGVLSGRVNGPHHWGLDFGEREESRQWPVLCGFRIQWFDRHVERESLKGPAGKDGLDGEAAFGGFLGAIPGAGGNPEVEEVPHVALRRLLEKVENVRRRPYVVCV